METTNVCVQLLSLRANPHRKADLLLLYLSEPTHCWFSAASRISQPTAVFLYYAAHTQCGGVLWWSCIHSSTVLFPLSFAPYFSVYLLYLCSAATTENIPSSSTYIEKREDVLRRLVVMRLPIVFSLR